MGKHRSLRIPGSGRPSHLAKTPVNPRYHTRAGLKALVVAVAIAIPLLAAGQLHDSMPPIEVWVNDHPHFVPKVATFGQVVRTFHVTASRSRDTSVPAGSC